EHPRTRGARRAGSRRAAGSRWAGPSPGAAWLPGRRAFAAYGQVRPPARAPARRGPPTDRIQTPPRARPGPRPRVALPGPAGQELGGRTAAARCTGSAAACSPARQMARASADPGGPGRTGQADKSAARPTYPARPAGNPGPADPGPADPGPADPGPADP